MLLLTSVYFSKATPTIDSLLLKLEHHQGSDSERIAILIELSWQTNRSEPEKSLEFSKQAIDLSRESGLKKEEALSLNAHGVAYYYISQYDQALDYFFKVLKIYQKLNDTNRMSSTYTNIGNCYEKLLVPKQALTYQNKALELTSETGNLSMKASILNNIGNIYIQSSDYEQALVFHKESLKIKKQVKDSVRLSYAFQNIGIAYLRLDNFPYAIAYLDSAIMAFKKYDFLADVSNAMIDLANAYRQLNDQQKSISYLDSSLALSQKVGNLNSEMLAHKELSEIYESMDEVKKSFKEYKAYSIIKDSLFTDDRERKVMELNTLYELEKKNKNLAALQLVVAEEKQKKTIAIITGSFVLVLLLFAVYYIRLRAKNQEQKDQLAELEKEKQIQVIEMKNRELMTTHLQQVQKKELLEKINDKISSISRESAISTDKKFKELKSMVRESLHFDSGWDQLKLHFERVHPKFFKDLERKYPNLTSNEKRHCAYIKLNLSTKEISQLLNISDKSVQMARYRMKKKMMISPDSELQEVIHSLGEFMLVS